MPKSVSTRSAYKMLTCIYLCRTLLFFAPYADFLGKEEFDFESIKNKAIEQLKAGKPLMGNRRNGKMQK